MKIIKLIALLLVIGFASGCSGKTVSLDKASPGKYELTDIKKLVLVQVKGNPTTAVLFKEYLADQIDNVGTWKFEERLEQKIKIYPKATNLYVAGAEVAEHEIFMRIDLGDWIVKNMSAIIGKNKKSKVFATTIQFHATCIGHGDKKIIDRGFFSGTALIDNSLNAADTARSNALKQAINEFVREITPVKIKYETSFDVSAKEIKPIEELVNSGKTTEARKALEKILAEDKTRPDILYNIAVTYDLEGRYRRALDYYDQALRNLKEDNSAYEKAKAECARKFVVESSK